MQTRKILLTGFGVVAFAGMSWAVVTAAGDEPAIIVVNESGKSFSYNPADLAKLPQKEITARDHRGETGKYTGVELAALLKQSEVVLGMDLRGPLMTNSLLVDAADKYRVVFSIPEIDPEWTENVVLLATARNGEPLDAAHGPFQIVVPGDKRHGRWVRQVTRLTVRAEAKVKAPGQ
jgi:DMSO/TMAO reductase YedYZ molybdopterin-dependent catalytic subunit